MHNFKELVVWQKAIELASEIYQMTETFPSVEKYGLISQINRSVVSIPSNIAEGAGRNTNGEFVQFLGIALGSLFELESLLIISEKVGIIQDKELMNLSARIEEISKMIAGLRKSLK